MPGEPTSYSKRILLLPARAESEPIELRLSARIGLPLRVEPVTVPLGKVLLGQPITKSVTIYNDGDQPLKLLYATSVVPGSTLAVPRDPIPPGGHTQVSAKLTPSEKWSSAGGIGFNLRTTEPNQPTVQVTFRYELGPQ